MNLLSLGYQADDRDDGKRRCSDAELLAYVWYIQNLLQSGISVHHHVSGRRQLTTQSLLDFFVDNDIDLYPALGGGLEHAVETILFILGWRTPEIEFRRQPPCRCGQPGRPGDSERDDSQSKM